MLLIIGLKSIKFEIFLILFFNILKIYFFTLDNIKFIGTSTEIFKSSYTIACYYLRD